MPDQEPPNSYRPFRLEITGILRLLDPLHIGTGERLSLSTDSPILLDDVTGLPYIPGASLRGALRDHLEREAALLGCSPSHLNALFGLTPGRRRDEPSWAGRLTVFDAYLDEAVPLAREVRDHVRLHRSWAAADSGAKFDNEVALPADHHAFDLRLVYEGDSEEDPELVLIEEAVRLLLSGELRLGAKSGWGYGRVQLDPPRYQVYERSSPAGMASFLSARLGSDPSFSDSFAWPRPPGRPRNDSPRDPFSILLFRLRLHFEGPVLVKAPLPPVARVVGDLNDPATYAQAGLWEADHVFLHRSSDKAHYLPGSSIRGVLRSQAERIGASLATPLADRLFGWAKSSGNGGRRGVIEIGDGVLQGSPHFLFLDHVAIDRITAAAVDAKKFSLSALASPKFDLSIRLQFTRSDLSAVALWAFLLRDLMNGRLWAGSGVSRGYGYIRSAEVLSLDGNLLQSFGWSPPAELAQSRVGRVVFTQPGSVQFREFSWLWNFLQSHWETRS